MSKLKIELGDGWLARKLYHERMDWQRPDYRNFTRFVPFWPLSIGLYRITTCIYALALMHASLFAQSRFLPNDIQLRGAQAQHTLTIKVNSIKPQGVELKLHWTTSTLLNRTRSIVNILVDGQIRSTRNLEDLETNGWKVNLRHLKPGLHELSFQVHLRGKNEDCTPLPESLWVSLLDVSTIRGASRHDDSVALKQLAIRDFPNTWRAELMDKSIAPHLEKPSIALTHNFAWNSSMATAWLQAQLFLAKHGLRSRPSQQPISNQVNKLPSSAQLYLRSLAQLERDHPAAKRWRDNKDTLYVLYAPNPLQLEVIAKTPEDIQIALDLLNDDARRQVCHQDICSFSASDKSNQAHAEAIAPHDTSLPLWHMASGDQPRGWTAQGVGTHRLRQVWIRPLAMNLQSDVTLHMVARASQSEQIDLQRSSISIRINDLPLSTYSLSAWKSSHAKVAIPHRIWRSNAWVIDFEIRLVPRHLERCNYSVQEDFWVSIDPETQLEANYEYVEAQGIAGFWQRSIQRPVVLLTWSNTTTGLPSEHELASFTTLLQAFQNSTSGLITQHFSFSEPARCKDLPCIVLHPHSGPSTVEASFLDWKKAFSRIPEQAKHMPDLNAKGNAVIAWLSADARQAEQLHFILDASQNFELKTPSFSSLVGAIAIHSDQWHLFANETVYHSPRQNKTSSARGNVSQQQSRLRWINLLWALICFVIVGAFAIAYWRKKHSPDPKTWEVQ